jgi:acyl-coenzyme A thioesterase PaaI-like protein
MLMDRPPLMRAAPDPLAGLAEQVHALTELMLRTIEGDDFERDVQWAEAQLESVRSRLSRHARRPELNIGRPDDPEDGRPYYVSGVLVGRHHPMYMPIDLATHEGVTRGKVRLDITWEGPPGCVHGGYIAHLFDCLMGQHNLNVGIPGMTGSLSVRYRRPTPLHTELRLEARTERASDRKIVTRARIEAGDELTAQAEGLFIIPKNFTGNLPRLTND